MRKRAFTLAEVLVGASLSLLILGLLVSVCLLMSRCWRKTSRLQTAQASTLVAVTRLREDYRQSKPGSASIQGPVLSFLSDQDGSGLPAWDNTGALLWKCWVQYRWHNQSLERRQVALAPPASEPGGSPPTWPDGEEGHHIGLNLVTCSWTLTGTALLDISLNSEFETSSSASRLRILPSLYQPDSL